MTRAAKVDPDHIDELDVTRDIRPVVEHLARLEVSRIVRVPDPRPELNHVLFQQPLLELSLGDCRGRHRCIDGEDRLGGCSTK